MSIDDNEIDKILNELKQGNSDASENEADLSHQNTVEEDKQPDDEPMEEENEQAQMFTDPEPDESDKAGDEISFFEEYEEKEIDDLRDKPNRKGPVIIAVVVVLIAVIAAGVYFGVLRDKEEPTTTTRPITTEATTAAPIITNPLTGEADYSKTAVGKRPVAVVVENSPQARPQYNMDTPDIIVEGEVEGGITRMLWLYADMTALPEQVGPTRSARPSYVEFSEYFDAIFVHFGESHSKGEYVGADDVIARDNVDNINGMNTSSCFKRTSDKASPHNAVLIGSKLVEAIEKKGYRTDIDDAAFTTLSFNEKSAPLSENACSSVDVKISSRTNTHSLTYDSAENAYINESDYGQKVSFTNIVVMMADTQYVNKSNYKGSGKTETYCNYIYSSGTAKFISGGTFVDVNWTAENGRFVFKDAATGKNVNLNPGNTWFCLASQNNGGTVTIA